MNNIVDNIRGMNPHKGKSGYAPFRDVWNKCCDAFAQQLSSIQSAGVWRKASEKLPSFVPVDEIHYRLDGVKSKGILLVMGICDWYFQVGGGLRAKKITDLSRVEWLDEADPTPIPVPGEGSEDQDGLWKELYKFIEEYGMHHFITKECLDKAKQHFTITRNTINNAKQ